MTHARRPPSSQLFGRCAALLVTLAACPRRDARPDPLASAAGRCRDAPAQAAAVEAVLAHDASLRLEQLRELRWIRAELDGRPPAEAVVAAAVTGRAAQEDEAPPGSYARQVWAIGCADGHARVLASYGAGYGGAGEGTFEAPVGFTTVEAERVVAAEVDVLRVEFDVAQGEHDPRSYERQLVLLQRMGEQLAPVFRCALSESAVSGPARAGVTTNRAVRYEGGWPRRIVVRTTRSYDPGALEGAEEIAADQRARGYTAADATEEAHALRGASYAREGAATR